MTDGAKLHDTFESLSPDEFESLVATVWSEMGWSSEVTASSRDQGIDIIATKSGVVDEKVVIQAKRYSEGNKIGRPEIQQYNTLRQQIPDADAVIVVTSSGFTSEATALAEELNIKTVNGNELVEACLTHLPDDRLSDIRQASHGDTEGHSTVEAKSSEHSISVDNLSESELDLAKAYDVYYQRLRQDVKAGEQARLLYIGLKESHSPTTEYSVVDAIHSPKFSSDSPKLWLQLQQTAEKYGWKVNNAETYGRGAGGVEMKVSPEKATTFSVSIDTRSGDTLNPKRQARITKLILDKIYDQELSGTQIREFATHTHDTLTRVIK